MDCSNTIKFFAQFLHYVGLSDVFLNKCTIMSAKQVKKVKKAAKSAAKKATPKKASKKKASPKKATAKKTSSKKATKPASTKKTAAKKGAKKSVSKKAVSKKSGTKKTTAVASKAKKTKPTSSKKVSAKKGATKKSNTSKSTTPKKKTDKKVNKTSPKKQVKKPTTKKKTSTRSTAKKSKTRKTRYNQKELDYFGKLINQKLVEAKEQLAFYLAQIKSMGSDPDTKIKGLEDGTTTSENEQMFVLAGRQRKYIQHLENAKLRIQNKVYGVCRVTGNLISKARLEAVPHATLSIDAKRRS